MNTAFIDAVWACADYAPTADRLAPVAHVVADRAAGLAPAPARIADVGAGHGHLADALAGRGYDVLALEPVSAIRARGEERSHPSVTWCNATAEETGLPDHSVDVLASSFGWMFGHPETSAAEAVRVLRPGGALVFTAWASDGFLHDMTQRMVAAAGGSGMPPHMLWGVEDVCRQRLEPWFGDVTVERRDLPWCFDSVEDGLRLYADGSPTHTFSIRQAGERGGQVRDALETQLREYADPDTGRIESSTGYVLVTASTPRHP